MIFVLSSFARLTCLWRLRGTTDVVPADASSFPLRTLTLRPSAGAVQRPVLAGLPEGEPDDAPRSTPGAGDPS